LRSAAYASVSIENCRTGKQAWVSKFLELSSGIPSHDTAGRVFRRRDIEQFHACDLSLVQAVLEFTDEQEIAVVDQRRRRSCDEAIVKAAMQRGSRLSE